MDDAAFVARFVKPTAPRPHPGAYPIPPYEASWVRFGEVVSKVGGLLLPAVNSAERDAVLAKAIAEVAPTGRRVGSNAALAVLGDSAKALGIDRAPDAAADPHSLADVELAVLWAELAVAENGALLLSSQSLPERALAFLPQRTLILVPADRLVADLHTAQARLPVPPPHHMTWVSGPSKTADIEQTLVIGAHGARSLMVLPLL